MVDWFSTNYTGTPFQFFTTPHFTALISLALVYSWLFYFRNGFRRDPDIDLRIRYGLAAVLIAQELSLNLWRLMNHTWSPANSLPLHLCGVSVVLSAIMLVNKNYLLYEINYFWGLGGAVQALLTPDIGIYGFPHFRYFQFFVSHGSIILAVLYMTWVHGYRPRLKSVWKIFGITNLYLVVIAGFNWVVGGNYLFICEKPVGGSLLDFLGPWPWYIVSLEFVGIISFLIYYLPWLIRDRLTAPEITADDPKLPETET
ncbi:MAG: TIGR02206 family membrane protein [Lentisphaeria bacterium]|nr:TIGR02206 family membrane protein [Candidatus Neomarinimicrobiota bacterium]MCF7842008.1 TIGR02206 family membrane protein [Lentisphaeria bacterium]